jgi:cytoskeletal protein RodZ
MLKDFGLDLKYLRESKNISLAEIAAETRINPKFLSNFEAGIFDFQPETYIRAFLKEYAQCIGENESQILGDYERAKSGFYQRRFQPGVEKTSPPIEREKIPDREPERIHESVSREKLANASTSPESTRPFSTESNPEELSRFRVKRRNQKIIVGVVILFVAAGIIFLINYLNKSSGRQSSEIRPKSFNEMASDYESRMQNRGDTQKTDTVNKSSLSGDTLILTVKASRDVRIKVYLDENQLIEETIPEGDSLVLKAGKQFRFSATANAPVDLALNGKPLQKPRSLTGTSIKNLIIKREGIVEQ